MARVEDMTLAQLNAALANKIADERCDELEQERDELVERISLIDDLLARTQAPDVDEAPEPPRLTFHDVEVAVLAVLDGRLLTPREIHKGVITHLDYNGLATREITRVLESLVEAGKVSHIGRGLHELA